MLQIQNQIAVQCPNVAVANDYPPRKIPGGKIVAWNESPQAREKDLIFLVKWNGDGWEIFRKSVYKPSTLKVFIKGKGHFLNAISTSEIKKAIKKKDLFPYPSSLRERADISNVLSRIAA